jgi:hypothetical protein
VEEYVDRQFRMNVGETIEVVLKSRNEHIGPYIYEHPI